MKPPGTCECRVFLCFCLLVLACQPIKKAVTCATAFCLFNRSLQILFGDPQVAELFANRVEIINQRVCRCCLEIVLG